jgi:hypothetical protein
MLAAAVPYDLDVETALGPALRERLAFARQNVDEVVLLFRAPHKGRDAVAAEFAAGRGARGAATRDDPGPRPARAAGLRVVQVDAPALRELLPLRAAHRPAYVAWPVDAFRLVTVGVANSAQVQTHLCRPEFGDVVEAIDGLDADVTTVEVVRAKMEVLADLGPGMPRARARDVRHALPTGAPTPRCANIPSPGRSP